jgi:hypothetical protein
MGFAFKKSRDAVKKLASEGTPAGVAVVKKYHKEGGAPGVAKKVRSGVKDRTLLGIND